MRVCGVLALALMVLAATSLALAQNQLPVNFLGLTSLQSLQSEIRPNGLGDDLTVKRYHPGHSAADVHPGLNSLAPAAPASIPSPHSQHVVAADPGFFGFAGLNHFDQRFAGTGAFANTQFSLVPPDQGLCVGGGFVMEAVNTALAVYGESGTLLKGPVALNQFFHLHPEFIRPNGPFGEFITDPRCYYDAATRRWFLTLAEIDVDPATGNFTDHSSTLLAVSETSDPTGTYFLYSFDSTDGDGTQPGHPGCPCFGDQPLIGADANGFYVSTNEFSISSITGGAFVFNGAQVYALSKAGLAAGNPPKVVHINAGAIPVPPQDQGTPGALWYSIQPATSPAGGEEGEEGSGTEYFLSALQFGPAPYDNRIAAWALTNTESLNGASPNPHLLHTVIASESYGVDPTSFSAPQKRGSTPLRDALGDTDPLERLTANDDRMNQVVFAKGDLWAGVNTSVANEEEGTRIGIAWFDVTPSLHDGKLSASIHNQGYVSVGGQNVMFPSIGVNTNGNAVMTFTLVGRRYWPSAAYAPITNQAGNVRVAGAGLGPNDAFDGYAAFGGASPVRWGDYSAAVADGEGNIWIAAEYIGQTCTDAQFAADSTCGHTRSLLANWGTFIGRISADSLSH